MAVTLPGYGDNSVVRQNTATRQLAEKLDDAEAATAAVASDLATETAARIAADALKAPLASPVFTGNPQAPTPGPSDDGPSVATKEYVDNAISAVSIPDFVQTDFISGIMPIALDGDYRLIVNLPYAATITSTTTRCVSGTATATFKINTTALGGTANSVSSTENEQPHSSANSAAAGDDIVLTISSASTCVGLSFTIEFTRTLA